MRPSYFVERGRAAGPHSPTAGTSQSTRRSRPCAAARPATKPKLQLTSRYVHGRASQPRSTELRASAVSVSGSLHLSAAEGSESAAHLALLSGHARANGGAGQGIESVTDDQVTLRRHWRRPTKGSSHPPRGWFQKCARPRCCRDPGKKLNLLATARYRPGLRGLLLNSDRSANIFPVFPQSFPQSSNGHEDTGTNNDTCIKCANGVTGRRGGGRGGAGGHAGRAGGRESAAHAARPAPSAAPSHAWRSTLSAPGQDQLLPSGVGPLFWL